MSIRWGLAGLLLLFSVATNATEWSTETHQIAAGDFNGDGKDDLLVIAKDEYSSSGIILSDGSGQPNIIHQSWGGLYLGIQWHSELYKAHVGDFDGNGLADVLLQRDGASDHYLLRTDSSGKLTAISQTISNNQLGYTLDQSDRNVVIGDYNGDGRSDLLLQPHDDDETVAIAEAASGGTFSTTSDNWATDHLGFAWSANRAVLHAGDFDGDGVDDILIQARPRILILGFEISIPISYFTDLAFGIVTSASNFNLAHQMWDRDHLGLDWSANVSTIFIGDFNGDGRDDVFLQANGSTGTSTPVITDANGQLTTVNSAHALDNGDLGTNWTGNNANLIVGDFDGNGRSDLYLQSTTSTGTYGIATSGTFGKIIAVTSHDPGSIADANTAAVGAIEGSLSVSNGKANYSIPIIVPPGRKGMAPQLSLSYNSGSGNGHLGVGWSLGGLSAIHRCPATWDQDGFSDGVEFDAQDRFCMDGKRLVLFSGTYGAANSVYRTELDEFSRITADNQAGSGPKSFVVETKDGRTLKYGKTSSSRVEAEGQNSVRTWAISSIEDQHGNKMEYTYVEDEAIGEYYISEIHYTLPSSVVRKVKFNYGSRPDEMQTYLGGSKRFTTKRLLDVETFVGTRKVRKYSLSYGLVNSPATGRSRIEAISECAYDEFGSGEQCYAPTTFEWQGSSTNYDLRLDGDPDEVPGIHTGTSSCGANAIVDFNGDGFLDGICPDGITQGSWVIAWGKSGGFEDAVPLTNYASNPQNIPGFTFPSRPTIDYNHDGLTDFAVPVDVGGTGQNEELSILYFDENTDVHVVDLNIPVHEPDVAYPSSIDSNTHYLTLDVNGDGKQDIVTNYNGAWRVHLRTATGFSTQANPISSAGDTLAQVIDYDGDGRSDLFVERDDADPRVLVSNSSGFYVELTNIPWGNYNTICYEFPSVSTCRNVTEPPASPIVADFNGDGLTDVVTAHDGGMDFYANTGNGFALPTNFANTPETNLGERLAYYIKAIDFDTDGDMDLLVPGNRTGNYFGPCINTPPSGQDCLTQQIDPSDRYTWNVMRFNGSGFDSATASGMQLLLKFVHIVDIDADGLADITGADFTDPSQNGYTARPKVYRQTAATPDRLIGITDGLSNTTSINYEPISDTTVYSRESTPLNNFPIMNFASNMHVVSDVHISDGIGGTNHTEYNYWTARYHLQGRGFLGFRETEEISWDAGLQTRTEYKDNFPFNGRAHASRVWKATGSPGDVVSTRTVSASSAISETLTTWAQSTTTTSSYTIQVCEDTIPPTCYNKTITEDIGLFVYPQSVAQLSRDLKTLADLSTVSTTNQYTSYGCLDQATVVTSDAWVTHTLVTDSDWTDNTSSWWLCRKDREQVDATIVHKQAPLPSGAGWTAGGGNATHTETRTTDFTYESTRELDMATVEPFDTGLQTLTSFDYDSKGNPITVMTSDASGLSSSDIRAIDTRTVSTTYTADGYFPETVTNALGHISSSTLDSGTGLPKTQTGPNGVVTTSQYDNFGRSISTQIGPDPALTTDYDHCGLACPYGAVYQVTTAQPGRPDSVVYLDAKNRQIQSETRGFDGSYIRTTAVYDQLGRTLATSEPHYVGDAVYMTTYQNYDELDRVGKKAGPNGMVTDYTYNGLVTSVDVSADGHTLSVSRTSNSLGQLVKTVDAENGVSSYRSDAFGNPVLIQDPAGNQTTAAYDRLGRKVSTSDPNMGDWTFDYDVASQLKRQNDAIGQQTLYEYDKLGRTTERREKPVGAQNETIVGTWCYDGANCSAAVAPNIGQLVKVESGDAHYKQEYSYDSYGRPSSSTTTLNAGIGSHVFSTSLTYDSLGRVEEQTYPDSFGVKSSYNANGYLFKEENASTGDVYRQINGITARGQIYDESLGPNAQISTTRSFNPATGLTSTVCTQVSGGCQSGAIQSFVYDYDGYRNMTSRERLVEGLTEVFDDYDNLHRLKSSHMVDATIGTIPGSQMTYTYDALGNFTNKSDFGTYVYTGGSSGGPNAVKSVNLTGGGSQIFSYDANGNQTSNGSRTVSYTIGNKPKTITQGMTQIDFRYSPDEIRWKKVEDDGLSDKLTTYYIDKLFEYVESNVSGQVKVDKRYYVGDYLVHVDSESAPGPEDSYLHNDHLGSVTTITDENGVVIDSFYYDVWGERNAALSNFRSTNSIQVASNVTSRGFTQHEMLDNVDLIHMNGRSYDPSLGRFLSVDPIIQFPTNSQSLNPYTYILNNPLSGTDPTGYASKADIGSIESEKLDEIYLEKTSAEELAADPYVDEKGNFVVQLKDGRVVLGTVSDDITGFVAGELAAWGPEDISEIGGTSDPGGANDFDGGSKTKINPEDLSELIDAGIDVEGVFYAIGNWELDQWLIANDIYGRDDLTYEQIVDVGDFGTKEAWGVEAKYHRIGEGNEKNLKFTSKIQGDESFFQEEWSNRYGRYEIIVSPNDDGTFTHVKDGINRGTLNRGNSPIKHYFRDVRTFKKYGTNPLVPGE